MVCNTIEGNTTYITFSHTQVGSQQNGSNEGGKPAQAKIKVWYMAARK